MADDSTTYYSDAPSSPDFPELEKQILDYWRQQDAFKESVRRRDAETNGENNEFVFYDGPPFANGLPHYGHLLTGYVKDIFARYQTMKGKRVERRFGWDCHGLPAEMGAEKELKISGRQQIQEFGVKKFNDHCRSSVMKYAGEWEKYVERQARWVDFENDYKTMDTNYMESVIWAFSELYKKGLVYESMRVMPYSWAAETPLSNFETRLDNAYRERADKAVTVAFELDEKPEGAPEGCDTYCLLAWTTTPWTLPSNLALAVGEDMEYACVKYSPSSGGGVVPKEKWGSKLRDKNSSDMPVKNILSGRVCYIIAKGSLHSYQDALNLDDDEISNPTCFKGSKLTNLTYKPLFPYFAERKEQGAFRVLKGDFIEEGSGTGIVHLAPGFGEDDMRVCEEAGIELVCPVDGAGCYTSEVYDLEEPSLSLKGLNVISQTEGQCEAEPYKPEQLEKYGLANLRIINYLKMTGKHIDSEDYLHNYPHCWRTDTPLIYKAVPSWYVEVTKFRDRMVELNQQINWIPSHIKDGQFGKWLENARDWSISRNRFWGSPIPVWRSDNPKNEKLYVFGSIKELEEFFEVKVEDLHKPFVDSLTKPDPEDSNYTLRRVDDVFDCWFESGSMPYAQAHYPFENKEWFEEHFPADFIVEYMAQTRGWFYTLMVLSTALFDRPPFLNCICHGVVLDDKGQKLSKRLQNYADPMDVFQRFGSDAMRWVMVSAPIMQGGELLIDKEGNMIRDAVRLVLKPVWNAYHFFTLYANADGIKAEFDVSSDNMMDHYILSKTVEVAYEIERAMDAYDTPTACKAVEGFFEVLNNWYIRRNKDRFWKSEQDEDKRAAYNTLYSVLHIMVRAMSPLLPLLTETIWQGLGEKESVHWQNYPDTTEIKGSPDIILSMDRVREVCTAALSIRSEQNIRVRQPLGVLKVIDENAVNLEPFASLIADEVNVHHVEFITDVNAYADHTLKILFPVLGKRLPAKMKDIIAANKKGEWHVVEGTVEIAGETLQDGEYQLLLQPKEGHSQGAAPLSTNDALVWLDLNITDDLRNEGIARDVVRFIQQSRKEADLQITDRIELALHTSDADMQKAVEHFNDYITEQTLAETLVLGKSESYDHQYHQKIEAADVHIGFSVAAVEDRKLG